MIITMMLLFEAPWGIVERNHELLGHNRDVPCHSISSPR